MKPDERGFEDAITDSLVAAGGYRLCKWGTKPEWAADFDRVRGLDTVELFAFIAETQPKAWERLVAVHGGIDGAKAQFADRLAKQLDERGTVDVLRHGGQRPRHRGPARVLQARRTASRPSSTALYESNRLTVTRQLPYEAASNKTLDLALFLNGIPVATAELKNPLTHQTVEHAKHQYRTDRDPANPTLRRALVHFAVDPDSVEMTTKLAGASTRFLPFNRGNAGGKGNAPDPTGHRTRYLWEELWARDAWLDILARFIHVAPGRRLDEGRQAPQRHDDLPALPPVGRRPLARGDRPRGGPRALVPRPAQRGLGQEQHDRLARSPPDVAPRRRRSAGLRQGRRHHRPGDPRPPAPGDDLPVRARDRRRRPDRPGQRASLRTR